jgi:MYXO-CTERM domain-containing protein
MQNRLALGALVTLLSIFTFAGRAHAGVHLIKIVEVFPGTVASPSAQYVELQMFAGGQIFTAGSAVVVYDAANTEVARYTFAANLANGADQASILVATTQATTLFGVTPDLVMTAGIPLAGGKVCFEAPGFGVIDCVAWGSHPGGTVGGAAAVGVPFSVARGLVPGRSIQRRLEISGSPTVLDSGDDTNVSASDFAFATPSPRNNAGITGIVPPSTCGDSTIAGLEGCDDGNTTSGDGCSAMCVDEACADSIVNDSGETCDDGNLVSGDGCDANCRTTACGNGIVTMGETCDDGNATSGDGCDVNCRPTGCGNGVVTTGEACDDANMTSGDGCDVNCTPTGCGNGVITAGEACEPPSVGACDASCQMGCGGDVDCADTDPCTTNERCTGAACLMDATPTDDAEPCTMDGCDAAGVFHMPLTDGTTCDLASDPGERALCGSGVCGLSRCGDGLVDASAPDGAEECDDGNTIDTDACTAACTIASCGDGVIATTEECDDGNVIDVDACTMSCTVARCGDGSIQEDVEMCDDGLENGMPGHCPLDCGSREGPDAGAIDAGTVDAATSDAGRAPDAAAGDVGVRIDGGIDASAADAGTPASTPAGCSCRAGTGPITPSLVGFGLVALALGARRRRKR